MVQMRPPTVTNFLYFFNLITANVVIGWIHFVLGILFILVFFYLLIFNSTTDVKVENIEMKIDAESHDEFTDTFDIIVRLIVLVVAVFVTFISFWFVHGIRTCDPTKMKPYLFFTGTFVFLGCCTAVVTLNFFTLIIAIVELYFFICAYSLYFSFLSDPNIQQDVVYKNPTAHGYSQAFEGDGFAQNGTNYYPQQQQQQADGYYSQEKYYEDVQQGQQQGQQQFYNNQ